jgi:hypothetical protein
MAVKKIPAPPKGSGQNGSGGGNRTKKDVQDKLYIYSSETASGKEHIGMAKSEKRKTTRERKGATAKKQDLKDRAAILANIDNPKSKAFHQYDLILDEVVELYTFGLSLSQIAQVYNIHGPAFNDWCNKNPEAKNKIESARRFADSRVVASLYNIALGNVSVHERQWEETQPDGTVIKHKTKQLSPNAYAALQWLTRRDPARWSESEVVKKQIQQEFEELSDEQLTDMIERIMEKAGRDKTQAVMDSAGEDEDNVEIEFDPEKEYDA